MIVVALLVNFVISFQTLEFVTHYVIHLTQVLFAMVVTVSMVSVLKLVLTHVFAILHHHHRHQRERLADGG